AVGGPAPGAAPPIPASHKTGPASAVSAGGAAPPRSTVAAPDLAVRVTGYLGHTLGLGAAARGYLQALDAANVSTSTMSVPLHHLKLPLDLPTQYGRQDFED